VADRRRIVTMSPGGRPILELDLEVAPNYQAIKDTFAYAPGQANQQDSREPGRYGGSTVVGEQNDNGTVSWQALVKGNTPDQVAQNVEALLSSGAKPTRNRLLEWRPQGFTYSSYFRIAGPVAWKPTYSWSQMNGEPAMLVDMQVPVRPLVLWDPMRIVDPFDVDSRSDYTFDAATSADVTANGIVEPVVGAALTAERRARHTARGYRLLEGQATIKSTPGTTIAGHKTGVLLRASAPDTYIEVYVDDNGTNSRLRIDVVIAGVRTTRASVNLASRISTGAPYWVRGRVENETVFAEHFAAFPSPTLAATTTSPSGGAGYALTGGEQDSLVAGPAGWSWVPQHAVAMLDDFEFRPVTDAGNPMWALFAWSRSGVLGLFDTNGATLSGWTETSDSDGLNNAIAKATTTSSAATYSATWSASNLTAVQADDFTDGRCELEVWARATVSASLANPRLKFSIRLLGASETHGEQFALPYGSVGKVLVKPASGTVRRFVRLGTVTVSAEQALTFAGSLRVVGSVDAGGSGSFGLDYIFIVPANRRACGPTGVAGDSTYPMFMIDGAKTTRSDLSGLMITSDATPKVAESHGLGGNLILLTPGEFDFYAKLSDLVPDDPTIDTSTEAFTLHTFGLSIDVTPRSYVFRGT
jgi:hypothetical protein